MKYNIGQLGFKTKDAAKKYTRSIINTLGVCIIDKDHEAFEFMYNLIQNHSEREIKIGVGIDYFELYVHPLFKNLSPLLHRIDGSVIDFSWIHCCEFKPRPPIVNFKSALRMAIYPQTSKFKQNNVLICNLCKSDSLFSNEYHVDHVKPFSLLLTEFMKVMTYPMPEIFDDDPLTNNAIFRIEDKALETQWINYHFEHASFQILCKFCNLKKSNKYEDS